jgi:hypothetical protein
MVFNVTDPPGRCEMFYRRTDPFVILSATTPATFREGVGRAQRDGFKIRWDTFTQSSILHPRGNYGGYSTIEIFSVVAVRRRFLSRWLWAITKGRKR